VFKPTILVTAASGKTGTATALQLLARGYPVRAMVHREDARSERLRTAGAQITIGSLEDIEDLRASLSGAHRAYFCPPLLAGTLRRATLFAAAAQEAGLEVIVALSQWVADPLHPALHAREKWLSNHVLQTAGVDVVTVAPGWFADNYMAVLEAVAQFGLMAMPLGDGLNAPPSNEDIARVIVGALTDPGPHIGDSYRPTGPRLLTPDDIAATFANVLGRRVSYKNVSLTTFLKAAAALGYPDYVITQLYWFLQDYQHNAFGRGAPTQAVLEVGGSPPEDFEQIVRRYVNLSKVTKRTISAKLRAALHLMQAAATRAPQIDKTSTITHATLAVDSPIWLQSHDPSDRHVAPGELSQAPN
jgi:NAD(P)H dehydrogenase (quinone)